MNRVFADSYFFIALLYPRDRNHSRVKAYVESCHVMVVTTSWVIVEVADAFCKPEHRHRFGQLIGALTTDPNAFVVPCSQLDLDAGIHLYLDRPDKAWSLTDCISFEVMQRERITHALTGDRHFLHAGFTIEFP